MSKVSNSFHQLVATLLVCAGVVTAEAQNRERFVISAKAGGINAVSGRTAVQPQGSSGWEQLTIKDNLEAGDMVKTGVDGRVEMLLNPGAYLRVGENSEFELTNNSLENLEVRLISGTAIVEATGTENTELMINITTPHTKMAIVRRGLYRVNVVPGDATELIVRKGRVLLSDSQIKVKGGRKLIFSGHTFSMAKLEKADKEKDAIESWSKERAETVAKANRRISFRDLNMALASFSDRWSRGFSNGSSGVWVFNPRFQCYTFLPYYFGWGSWGSPYGGSYSNAFYGYGSGCCGGRSSPGVWTGTSNVGSTVPSAGASTPSPSNGGNSPVYTSPRSSFPSAPVQSGMGTREQRQRQPLPH
ncbi:MAG: FecR domain-containing protein [Pyrinomonadaceae bacterium]|jgi:ferric-dicitrate binding protein FerR (iron transport regulator)|nr:FecR domain-containing protein [Pyrinomonadaceae bacterium]